MKGAMSEGYELLHASEAQLFFPTSPLPSRSRDVRESTDNENLENDTSRSWGYGDYKTDLVTSLEKSIEHIMDILNDQGPFIGVIGFSAGASVAAIIASLLEQPKRASLFKIEVSFLISPGLFKSFILFRQTSHPPLRFAVCFSGFKLSHPDYRAIYYPKIRTPILHVIGTLDPIIPSSDTLTLVKRCQNTEVFYFPGTHYVPRTQDAINTVIFFVKRAFKSGGVFEDAEGDWEDL